MNSEVRWLSRTMVEAFQKEAVFRFGGAEGRRDEALLESALARPRRRHAYDDDVSLFQLAADYCAGIVRNHPFVDGNKRAGLLAGRVFLALNGYRFLPDEAETVRMIRALAAGHVDRETLAAWFADYSIRAR